jgi:hypothetical protein
MPANLEPKSVTLAADALGIKLIDHEMSAHRDVYPKER